MRAGQKKIASDGKEVMLFPLPTMYITQGENGLTSHLGLYCIDFIGWGENGRILKAPIYAPCSCTCVAGDFDYRVWQSDDVVHTADGGLKRVCFQFAHDDTPPAIGTHVNQGDLIAHTGTTGYVTGDHTHFNTAIGTYQGWETRPPMNYSQLQNSTHIYDVCYIDDTEPIDTFDYNWRKYGDTPTPPTITKNKKFKWVLFANNIRKRNTI